MAKTISISSISNFVGLARRFPLLLNVGALSLLKDPIQTGKFKGCACKGGSNAFADYRPQFEAAMAMLSESDKTKLKAILATDQICYYRKNEKGQINKICF